MIAYALFITLCPMSRLQGIPNCNPPEPTSLILTDVSFALLAAVSYSFVVSSFHMVSFMRIT